MIHIQLIPVALDQDSFPSRLIAQRMSSDQSGEAWLSELCIWTANSTAGDTISSLQAKRLISQLAIKCAHYNSKGKCPGIIRKNVKTKDFSLLHILWGSQQHNARQWLWTHCRASLYRPHSAPVELRIILEWVVWFLEINWNHFCAVQRARTIHCGKNTGASLKLERWNGSFYFSNW